MQNFISTASRLRALMGKKKYAIYEFIISFMPVCMQACVHGGGCIVGVHAEDNPSCHPQQCPLRSDLIGLHLTMRLD